MRYRVNAPAVASQVMGGEAILIHFDSGRYYSVEGSGADVVALLEAGCRADELVAALGGGANGEAIARFVRELVDEGLFVAAEADAAPRGESPAVAATFVTPVLTKYTDLEELLRLDPIHDVDDAGWPIAKVG